jgi:hypothetical protein
VTPTGGDEQTDQRQPKREGARSPWWRRCGCLGGNRGLFAVVGSTSVDVASIILA